MKQKQHQKHRNAGRLLSVFTAAALFATSISVPCNTRESQAVSPMAETTLSNPTTDSNGVMSWDCIYFGNYWQNDTNGDGTADQNDTKEPIKWRVLSVDGDDAFLLADQNLDGQTYNEEEENVTWETCTLRTWLNGTFLTNAFSTAEQEAIQSTTVVNEDNPYYGTEGGNNTTDKVYLLSMAEACNTAYGFNGALGKESETREAKNTAYATACGAHTDTDTEVQKYEGNGDWWLRSPGCRSNKAVNVRFYGSGNYFGNDFYHSNTTVRPALHVNISSFTLWSYAGKVTSEGGGGTMPTVTPTPTFATSSSGLVNPTIDSDGVTSWDCIYFGNYWQNDTNGNGTADQNDDKEAIKWRVLSVNGDDAFLLADQNLDCQPYNEVFEDVTWETCTLRTWLNGTFLSNAFSSAEQAAIQSTTVVNDDHSYYGTEGGNNTTDKVYLLSIAEACTTAYGFNWAFNRFSETREAKNTAYAKACGADTSTDMEYEGDAYWWLRSPGHDSDNAAYVGDGGYGYDFGWSVIYSGYAVRPALHVNLSSSTLWSYAGKVTAEGGTSQTTAPTTTVDPENPTDTTPTATVPTAAPTIVPTDITPAPATSAAVTAVPTKTPSTATKKPSGSSYVSNDWDDSKPEIAKVSGLKVKNKKGRKLKCTWKKAKNAYGYQVQVATKRSFKKGKKTERAYGTTTTLYGLKKNKTYYVRVRGYDWWGASKIYGKWSAVKKIKIKK